MNNKRNKSGLKDSINQYRNIKGVFYECYTSNIEEFDEVRAEAKKEGLKVRLIKGELYREVKK